MVRKLFLYAPALHGGMNYVYNDEFKVPRAAGSVHGTAAEPGPATRNVADTENKISIASGALQVQPQVTPVWGQCGFLLNVITRAAGQVLTYHVNVSAAPAGGMYVGAGDTGSFISAGVDDGGLLLATNISFWNGTLALKIDGATPTGSDMFLAFVFKAAGCYVFIRKGNGNFLLYYHDPSGNTATPYPKLTNYEGAAYFAYLRVPLPKWLPTPEIYDTFTRANGSLGASEVAGPEAQSAPARAYSDQEGTVEVFGNTCMATALDGGTSRAIATAECGSRNVFASIEITKGTGVGCLVLRYVDTDNYIFIYHNGATARVDKRVGGGDSNVIAVVKGYVPGAEIKVMCDGDSFYLWYNEVFVNSGTISDGVFATSTKHGFMFTDLDSVLDDVLILPRGTGGEHNRLANFSNPSSLTIADLEEMQAIGLYDSNPIIPCDVAADDFRIREIGNVLYEPADTGKEYKTWYTGYAIGPDTDEHIYYAYSSDGENWTKRGKVIAGRRAEDPYIIKVGATYYLYAEDKEAATPSEDIRYWTSADGETWADQGQIAGITNCASPVVWKEGATWYMLYENYPVGNKEINLATSADGINWAAEATNPVMAILDNEWTATGLVPDDIVKISGVYYLLYHGLASVWKTGMATSADLLAWVDRVPAGPMLPDSGVHSPTTMVYYDTRYVLHYYENTDDSGILRGYPCKFNF